MYRRATLPQSLHCFDQKLCCFQINIKAPERDNDKVQKT